MPENWAQLAVVLWVVILVALGGYELYTLLDHDIYTPPLTHVVIRYAPWWVTLPVLGWLFVHFLVRYIKA